MNGPLKKESVASLLTLEAIKEAFVALLNNDEVKREDIKREVKELTNRKDDFGHHAEFWLLLALGTELGDPYHVYGRMAATYRSMAISRIDYSDKLFAEYLTLSYEQHARRASRSNAQINPDLKNRYRIAAEHARDRLQSFRTKVAH